MARVAPATIIAQLTDIDEKLRQALQSLADHVLDNTRLTQEVDAKFIYSPNLTYTPVQITANQNDYAQPETPGRWRLSTDAARDITGIAYSADGESIYIVNVGANNLTLKHQNAGSRAENRLICTAAADIVLAANEAALGWYDEITLRWRLFKL
jgi:hypothetical protein